MTLLKTLARADAELAAAGTGIPTRPQLLASGASFYMTLYDGITLDWFLTSPDPQTRELGEALMAEGLGSFVPADRERAVLRAAVEEDAARRGLPSAVTC